MATLLSSVFRKDRSKTHASHAIRRLVFPGGRRKTLPARGGPMDRPRYGVGALGGLLGARSARKRTRSGGRGAHRGRGGRAWRGEVRGDIVGDHAGSLHPVRAGQTALSLG